MLSPMDAQPLEDVPWVSVAVTGVFRLSYSASCSVCGAVATGSLEHVNAFADQHREHTSADPTHYGAGDLVAAFTKRMGIPGCTPCEQRRRAMNQAIPRVPWMRR